MRPKRMAERVKSKNGWSINHPVISGSGTPQRDWSHRKAWRFCRRTRFYAISLPSSRMESYFLLWAWFGDRECSVPTFSCLSPFLTLFPFLWQDFIINQPQTQDLSSLSHTQPSWNEITSFHKRQRFIAILSVPSSTPLPPPPPQPHSTVTPVTLEWRCWQMIYCFQSTSLSSKIQLRVCTCVCARASLLCVPVRQHVSVMATLPWRCRGLYLCCLIQDRGWNCGCVPPSTSHKYRAILTQAVLQCPSLRRPDNSRTPAASSLRNATVYPSEAPMHNTHARTHTNKLCWLPVEDMPNDWITSHFSHLMWLVYLSTQKHNVADWINIERSSSRACEDLIWRLKSIQSASVPPWAPVSRQFFWPQVAAVSCEASWRWVGVFSDLDHHLVEFTFLMCFCGTKTRLI